MVQTCEKTFVFTYDNGGETATVTVPITIPSKTPGKELAGRLTTIYNLPPYVMQGEFVACDKAQTTK